MASISSMDGRFSPADTVFAPTEVVCIGLSVRKDNGKNSLMDYEIRLCSLDNQNGDGHSTPPHLIAKNNNRDCYYYNALILHKGNSSSSELGS